MNTLTRTLGLTMALATSAIGSAQVKFWNTGEGLGSFARDTHWICEKVQGSSQFTGQKQAWVMDDTVYPVYGAYNRHGYSQSRWISFSQDAYCANDDIFRFTTKFSLPTGLGSATAGGDSPTASYRFTGKFSSDNASELYVNGHLVTGLPYYGPLGYSFQAVKTFDATQYLKSGENTVSFLVGSANTMGANVGPVTEWMGLRVEGQLNAVPEPASAAVVLVGAIGALRRRRNR